MGDWTSGAYITSQIFVVIFYLFIAGSYFAKKRWQTLLLVIACNTSLGIAFIFLNSWVGLGLCIIAVIRDTTSAIINKYRTDEDRAKITKLDCGLLAIWVSAMVIVTAFTQDGPLCWLACFASLLFTVSIWQKSKVIYCFLGLVSTVVWIAFYIYLESVFSIVFESVLLVAIIIGTYRVVKKVVNAKNQLKS